MELYVYSPALDRLGVVDAFSSVQWSRKYNTAGTFELHCPVEYFELLDLENIVAKTGSDEAGIIETRIIRKDEEGGEEAIISGRFLPSLLGRRIVWGVRNFTGEVEDLMLDLVDDAMITTDAERVDDAFNLGTPQGYTETVDYQGGNANLLTELEKLSETSDIGFRVKFTPTGFVFEPYKGVDRTAGTSAPAIFSRKFESIIEQEYTDSYANYRNFALIGGEDVEGVERVYATIGTETGRNRREMFVDAKGIKKTVDGVTMTEAEYILALAQEGWKKLAEHYPVMSVDADVDPMGNLVYGTDYDLGDKVTVLVDIGDYEVRIDTRITGAKEVYEDGFDVLLTFGTPLMTLVEKIRRM